jgi:hypothetical protein
MLALHGGVAEQRKIVQGRMGKINGRHTFTIGLTWSITCLITPTALFHVFTVSIASSAEPRVRDISVWLSTAGPTGVPPLVGRSPVRDEGDIRAVSALGCIVSVLESFKSKSALVGFGVLTVVVGEELALADVAIDKDSVAGPIRCLTSLPVPLNTISNSTCMMLSQTHQ